MSVCLLSLHFSTLVLIELDLQRLNTHSHALYGRPPNRNTHTIETLLTWLWYVGGRVLWKREYGQGSVAV